jgi:hypothetical protein
LTKPPSFVEIDSGPHAGLPAGPSDRPLVGGDASDSEEHLWDDTDSEKDDDFLDVFPEPAKVRRSKLKPVLEAPDFVTCALELKCDQSS